jgi:hypothetical protein
VSQPEKVSSATDGSEARDYRVGLLCLFSATLFTSLAGVILRHVEVADGWQVLFYRSLAFVAVLLLFLLLRHRGGMARAFRAVGRPGLVTALSLCPAFILFILALLETHQRADGSISIPKALVPYMGRDLIGGDAGNGA